LDGIIRGGRETDFRSRVPGSAIVGAVSWSAALQLPHHRETTAAVISQIGKGSVRRKVSGFENAVNIELQLETDAPGWVPGDDRISAVFRKNLKAVDGTSLTLTGLRKPERTRCRPRQRRSPHTKPSCQRGGGPRRGTP
jgi:hypothetical protein